MRRTSLLLLVVLGGCPQPPPSGFDDHTKLELATVADFDALAAGSALRPSAKFVITAFGTEKEAVRYLDSAFYSLHDEWYWFRLLNGQRVPGREGVVPVEGLSFESIADIYAWAKQQTLLPLDLRWVEDGRLYSPRFYELALAVDPRAFGLGTLIHALPSGGRPERWAFQLEFTDVLTHAELVRYFKALEATLPADVAAQVVWVVRSQAQEQFAQDVEGRKLEYWDRIIRMKDLTAPGETEVYNPGLTAGRLKVIRAGEPFLGTSSSDVLLLEEVPDLLPPAAGVVTAVPQTPLAHLNLLAKNRGIPNAYRAGVLDETELMDLARWRSPVIIQAKGAGELIIKPITEAQYATWLQLQRKPAVAVQQIDVSSIPYTYDLKTLSANDADALRPAIGGKATGYLGLLAGAPNETPDALMAISIRAYHEHLAPFRARLEAMLLAPGFGEDARVRFLVLEGQADFGATHASAEDQRFLQEFLATHPVGDVLGDFARGGGVKGQLRATPVAPATMATLTTAIAAQFGHYALTQGLRFRSSSTAEDVEGFNGAGLYTSNTGFLDPSFAPDPGDRTHTLEWALKKTWASYWGAEAFEERVLENIDHLSGNMAVVVHARFDDDKEKSNGVFLLTLHDGAVVMDLNVQAGALSVTNPTSTALPEVDRVTLAAGASTPVIERLRASTVVPSGTLLLTDAELLATFGHARAVATAWLERENATRPAPQRASTQVLDFEFRQVPEGWPALKTGAFPARIVLKQTRSLDPGIRALPASVAALPLPKDVLARARRVERRTCAAPAFTAVVVEALTNPVASPDLGYSVDAFTADVKLTFSQDVPALGVTQGEVVEADHLGLISATHPEAPARWSLVSTWAAGKKVSRVELREGRFALDAFEGSELRCTTEVLWATPAEFLLGLLG
ncbi:MAG: hypothetical protein ACOZQL_06195 [Myxococcota bacterium]